MIQVIGVDEAGYGPNLGPLVIASSCWEIGGDGWQTDFRRAWNGNSVNGRNLPPIDDSKKLYSPKTGIGSLESIAYAAFGAISDRRDAAPTLPSNWYSLCDCVGEAPSSPPWHEPDTLTLPLEHSTTERAPALADCWRDAESRAGARLKRIHSRIVFPQAWNEQLARWNNKATALSYLALELLRESVSGFSAAAPVRATCDKHGGRQRYAPFLFDIFSCDGLVETVDESPGCSRYRVTSGGRPVEIEFLQGGEAELPVALASIVAKYVREASMRAFNEFWRSRVPSLRPTAGYPVDAQRFRRETETVRTRLGISDSIFWRER